MLIEVDRICSLHNIKYSLANGTLLGAVRHKGFIPWDDDIDVMFYHEEYEKFLEVCKTDLDTSRFFLQDFRTDPNYRWGYAKLRRLGTDYVKKEQEHLKHVRGICIDLFDYLNVPNEKSEQKRYKRIMFCIRKALYSAQGKKTEKSILKKLFFALISLIPSKKINELRVNYIEKYRDIDAKLVECEMYPSKLQKLGFDKKMFESYTFLEFENRKFMSIANWNYFLTAYYGDYMNWPSLENRTGVMKAVRYKFSDVEIG